MSSDVDLKMMEEKARDIGRTIGKSLPKGLGFALLVFDFESQGEGFLTWISNAKRDDMLKALQEFMQKVGH